jgi:ABC-2 type transport system ATP-binding protein
MNSFAISTSNLSKSFDTIHAVNEMTLEVPRGVVFGFLGPNGSGKTTMIRLLLGLHRADHGSAEVLGFRTESQADQIRAHSGALMEQTGLYERLSALNNLDFYGRIWNLTKSQRNERIKELLSELGLWERRNEIIGNWSRGMKQKLAVARAMLHRPELIFLDEPTAGLDPVAAAALREDLEALSRDQGVTVFLTTHNLSEAEKMCQQVAVIKQGKLLQNGKPEELRRQTGTPQVTVFGSNFTSSVLTELKLLPDVSSVEDHTDHIVIYLKSKVSSAPLVSWLVGKGVLVEEVQAGQASLEEVFLTLVEEEKHD